VTSDPNFKFTTFFDIEWLRNVPNPFFNVTAFLKSNISKRCVLGTKILKNTNRKLYPVYQMVPFSMNLIAP